MVRILQYVEKDGTYIYDDNGRTVRVKTEIDIGGRIKEIESIPQLYGGPKIIENTTTLGGGVYREIYENGKLTYSSSVKKNKDGEEVEKDKTLYFGSIQVHLGPF